MYSTAVIFAIFTFSISLCACEDPKLYIRYELFQDGISRDFSEFNPEIPTQMHFHGFLASATDGKQYCNKLSKIGEFNCIAVDWTDHTSNPNYFEVHSRLARISFEMSEVIQSLTRMGMNLKDLTMIGHSIGAHLCGLIAKQVNSSNGKVGTIIGLDPAAPGFFYYNVESRLDKSDADYVQIIHTDVQTYGMKEPIGHADIYPNWGGNQPGCSAWRYVNRLNPCSHRRAPELWLEALTTDFPAYRCESRHRSRFWEDETCRNPKVLTIMGPNAIKAHGLFYFKTNSESPYVISDCSYYTDPYY